MRSTFFSLLLLITEVATPWGFQSHRTINEMAVYLLPSSSFAFYRPHIHDLIALATKADQRRYAVSGEAERHFLDVDHYESILPIDSIRISWDSACHVYGEDSLRAHGILPWNIQWTYFGLRKAIHEHDTALAIRRAADLGHYLADAHVPLHTSKNYNGQLSGQEGIHALWETRLPQLFGTHYRLWGERNNGFVNLDSLVWLIIEESHSAVDSVLNLEQRSSILSPNKFGFEEVNGRVIRTYQPTFCKTYHGLLKGMVERRMRLAVQRLALLWHQAHKSTPYHAGTEERHGPDSTALPLHGVRNKLH